MKDMSTILRSLGLIESESKTYMAALQHGPGTVVELTKLNHLSRQATYGAIETLTERGLMSSMLRGKKRYFFAEDPDKLLSYARRREIQMKEEIQDLERSLPELKLKLGGEHPAVRLFEGKEGLRMIIDDIEHSKAKTVDEVSDVDALRTVLGPAETQDMVKGLREAGTHFRVLYGGEPFGQTLSANRLLLPKEYWGFKGDVIIYGDKVAFMTFEGKMYSVIIESKIVARTLQVLFHLIFKSKNESPV